MKVLHTKAEALAQAKAWVDEVGGVGAWAEIHPCMLHNAGGEGMGGFILIVDRGGDDEGTLIAVADYNAETKKFWWSSEAGRLNSIKRKPRRKAANA
jgi:hypothetical protein